MRMWKIDPALLCLQHLMSEHVQMHMAAKRLNKGQDLLGYIKTLYLFHTINLNVN